MIFYNILKKRFELHFTINSYYTLAGILYLSLIMPFATIKMKQREQRKKKHFWEHFRIRFMARNNRISYNKTL